jgi:hypothetical protein
MSIDTILAERRATHGDYRLHARCTQELLTIAMEQINWNMLTSSQRETVHMTFHKMARILTGDPNWLDSWVDIIGYNQLIVNQLSGGTFSDPLADVVTSASGEVCTDFDMSQ